MTQDIGRLTARDLRVVVGDDEPRLPARRLGGRLGFQRAAFARNLIKRNLPRLERREKVIQRESPGSYASRGQPEIEYWLTLRQSLRLCFMSDAKNAEDIQDEVLDVFLAYRRGERLGTPLADALFAPPASEIERDENVLRVKHEDWTGSPVVQAELFAIRPTEALTEEEFKRRQRDPRINKLVDDAFWRDVPQMNGAVDDDPPEITWSDHPYLQGWFAKVDADGKITDSVGPGGNYWPWTREQFRSMPLDLRQRWWKETAYNRRPPSEKLLREIALALNVDAKPLS